MWKCAKHDKKQELKEFFAVDNQKEKTGKYPQYPQMRCGKNI